MKADLFAYVSVRLLYSQSGLVQMEIFQFAFQMFRPT